MEPNSWDPGKVTCLLARSTVPVLLTGETGTGKTRLAREIHTTSPRAKGPFIRVNCAAIPETLFESELFGHKRGSFTGATADRPGKFAAAHNGTIFLDEIGEMPRHFQAKLLHVIEEGVFTPVGTNETTRSDARIISATNRDLDAGAKDGTFRRDLIFRLAVYPLAVPPLRERRREILPLLAAILERIADGGPRPRLTPAAILALVWHDWPGNVRDLKNAIRFAAVNAGDRPIRVEDLPPRVRNKCGDLPDGVAEVWTAIKKSGIPIEKESLADLTGLHRATLWRKARVARPPKNVAST